MLPAHLRRETREEKKHKPVVVYIVKPLWAHLSSSSCVGRYWGSSGSSKGGWAKVYLCVINSRTLETWHSNRYFDVKPWSSLFETLPDLSLRSLSSTLQLFFFLALSNWWSREGPWLFVYFLSFFLFSNYTCIFLVVCVVVVLFDAYYVRACVRVCSVVRSARHNRYYFSARLFFCQIRVVE